MFNEIVKNLLLNATKACGAKVDNIMSFIGEQLTPTEHTEVKSFLVWSFTKNKPFRWENINDRFNEFKAEGT